MTNQSEKYFITIQKFEDVILQMPFIAENDKEAINKMEKLIVIWCDTSKMEQYNINLYKLRWLEGV